MANYYVAKNGNNGNLGTELSPWLTIQYAVTQAQAGDTVYIKAGTYNEAIELARSGSSGSPITFRNYPGDTPVIDGTATGEDKLIDWRVGEDADRNYITLQGLEIANAPAFAVWIEGDYNKIIDCIIHDAGSTGILKEHGDFCEFRGNHVYDVGYNGIGLEDGEFCITDDNLIHDTGHQCINVFSDTAEYYGMMDGNDITNNICYNADETGIYTRFQQNNIIANNVIYDNPLWGILLAAGGTGAPADYEAHTKLYNNTIVHNGYDGMYLQAAKYCTVKNNLFKDNNWTGTAKGQLRFGQTTGQVTDYSMFTSLGDVITWGTEYTLAEFQALTGQEAHGFVGTMNFLDEEGDDYRLTAESGAKDTGVALEEVTTDILGVSRPQGAAYDIGAYEYASGAPVQGITQSVRVRF